MRLLPNGLPADRTVCPDCLNSPRIEDCKTCGGQGMVCPQCRGARMVNLNRGSEYPVSKYRPCDCMMPKIDADSGHQATWGEGSAKRLAWRLDPQREIDAIVRYRELVPS